MSKEENLIRDIVTWFSAEDFAEIKVEVVNDKPYFQFSISLVLEGYLKCDVINESLVDGLEELLNWVKENCEGG